MTIHSKCDRDRRIPPQTITYGRYIPNESMIVCGCGAIAMAGMWGWADNPWPTIGGETIIHRIACPRCRGYTEPINTDSDTEDTTWM